MDQNKEFDKVVPSQHEDRENVLNDDMLEGVTGGMRPLVADDETMLIIPIN